jgi:uncharacterized membrane-anchored protein YitT (DUF2179 family)
VIATSAACFRAAEVAELKRSLQIYRETYMIQRTLTWPKNFSDSRLLSVAQPVVYNLSLITAGCLIFVIGMKSLLIPNHFITGGITGIAIIIHYWANSVDVGLVYCFLNIPLLLLGWSAISRRFILYSIFGMVVFSAAASIIQVPAANIDDPLLAAIFAGAICGTGGGLILRSVGSAGGFDILGVYVNQKWGFRPGIIIFFANLLPLMLGTLLYNLETVLYSIIYAFISAKVVNALLVGLNQRKSILIISEHAHAIADHILREEHRGVTFLKGEGAYTKTERKIIFTITTLTELPQIKAAIFSIDPQAFVVVNDTLEVLGKRHGSLKAY